jgi:hypothetical protein
VSSIKHSSVERTPETVASLGKLGLREDKVIIIAGSTDPLILPAERTYYSFLSTMNFVGHMTRTCVHKSRPSPPPLLNGER